MPPESAVVFTTTALAAFGYACWLAWHSRRVLTRERAASIAAAATEARDRHAYETRIRQLVDALDTTQHVRETAALTEADLVLTAAIDRYVRNTPEGGPR
ncbi:hypothetical protein ACFQ6Q_00280 [Streptomyces sp. NPDC056437]|uniref:hypothetical protein n=1 Tax=Streptomyces sp. NPDC056437 TaxID=3345816 RepID=UPI003674D2CD